MDWCKRNDIWLAFDNPYCDLTYDGYVAPSVLQIPGAKDIAIEFNSLSKTYNMAGWRVGMATGNARALEALQRVKSNVDTGIPNAIQYASAAALTGDQSWLADRNAIYSARRDVLVDGLNAAGLVAEKPKATLYVWAQTPQGWADDEQVNRSFRDQAARLLRGEIALPVVVYDQRTPAPPDVPTIHSGT